MSFKEQEIMRLWGRIAGDTFIVAIVYKDGHTETINYKEKRKASPSTARRNLTA